MVGGQGADARASFRATTVLCVAGPRWTKRVVIFALKRGADAYKAHFVPERASSGADAVWYSHPKICLFF